MKLGEALSLRARQGQRLNDLAGRVKANAVVQEGDNPAESVIDLTMEYLNLSQEHADLVYKITVTNVTTLVDGKSILKLLNERDLLIRERNLYSAIAHAAMPGRDRFRFGRNEIKEVAVVDVAELKASEEEMTEKIRQLDAKIQQINWDTELL